jgi:hypothetical protein
MHNCLQIKSVPPKKAQEMAESGKWVLIDVRPQDEFGKSSATGALNVPLFQQVNMSQATPKSMLRAAAYLFNGVKPVEPNPSFAEDLKTAAGGKGVIMVRVIFRLMQCPSVNKVDPLQKCVATLKKQRKRYQQPNVCVRVWIFVFGEEPE